ncbi:ATP-binding protein [Kutzneria chonburiensis]|uniref:Tetratricopeptide repeat protein n=1 Tax=Kutzneria chonburiensis TaxID=1483604 RepID=A0ABV6N1D0_9PSEU|nr:tetratricopeptide repeat protein [Kutzneria chonburiensis]
MSTGGSDNREPASRYDHRATLSGGASDVVQAGEVHGGVHFHGIHYVAELTPRQLPGDVGGFVNRYDELGRLDEVVAAERQESAVIGVFVVTGTAGVGKTSLALHWAHRVRHQFPDGQLYVNLRGYDPGPAVSADQALDRFLRALGIQQSVIPQELEDKSALYRSLLADRKVLVVLDNAATVRQVRPLLPGNAECLVIVTSRSRLSGLVARDGAHRLTVDVLPEPEAVNLLRVITGGHRPHDDPTMLRELAALCARLPLALRIAAERASSRPFMHLDELIADLRDESALWDALTAEDDEEADAVRTVFAWSYRALPEAAARLFRLLGLHPGPEFGISAAAALAGVTVTKVRNLLDVLVGAHVVEHQVAGRYQFHDLLRIYATEQAAQQETPEGRRDALQRVLNWYLHSAHAAVTTIAPLNEHIALPTADSAVPPMTFTDTAAAMRWYENERANLVAAVRSAAEAGLHETAWRIPATLRTIYARQNFFQEWIETSLIGLESARRVQDRAGEVELLDSLGKAYLQSQKLDLAEEHHRAALAIRRELGDRLGEAITTNALGLLNWRRRRLVDAVAHFESALTAVRDLGNRRWEAVLLSNLGMSLHELAHLESAQAALIESVALCRELGDRAYEGNASFCLARTQRERGDLDGAMASIESALTIAREERHHAWEAFWLLELARLQRRRGDAGEALSTYQTSAAIQRQINDRNREAMALDGTGETYRELGQPDEATKFHRRAAATFRETGDRWSLATALNNLARALNETEGIDRARPRWHEAAAILTEFDDPRSAALREEINDILTGT